MALKEYILKFDRLFIVHFTYSKGLLHLCAASNKEAATKFSLEDAEELRLRALMHNISLLITIYK